MQHLSNVVPEGKISPKIADAMKGAVKEDESKRSLEALLIAVSVHKDREAFAELFNQVSGKVFGLGMKIFHNEQFARDMVQDAMLTVWQKAPLFDSDKGAASTWIFTVARNRGFDMLRRRKSEPQCVSADDIWPLGDHFEFESDEEEVVEDFLELRHLQAYMSELPEAQREIVTKVYIEDKTHQEVAEELSIPLGTVKSRLRLAISKLRDNIGGIQ